MDLSNKAAVSRLIEGCLRGDRKSQHYLYKSFYGKMLAVCYRYAGSAEEARDLLHDGFIKVFQKLGSFKNVGSFEGWIRRIMVNNAIDHIRKRKDFIFSQDREGLEKLEGEADSSLDDELYLQAEAAVLLRLLQKLSPAYRTVFSMYVIEEYQHKEIAEELGISVGTSKSNLAKAKQKLRALYLKYKENESK